MNALIEMTNAKHKGQGPKTIHLANELDHLQDRMSTTWAFHHDMDSPEKQRVVAARRVKLSGW
jgi:hypothetical protein